jgi:creatinine amidohydrolase
MVCSRRGPLALGLAAALAFGGGAVANEPTPSVFTGTIADMTYVELEAAAKDGAVALWALGSIEEHGPHLPLATDVYIPSEQLRRVHASLAANGVKSVIVPPYYWGVNRVTGAFPGSIDIRPEVMVELMSDVFLSLARAGVKDVYCITGHYDAAHGRAIADAVRRANADGTIRAHFVLPSGLGRRLGLSSADPGALLVDPAPVAGPSQPDLHAGEGETSVMLRAAPATVRERLIPSLKSTDLSPEQVAAWRVGGEAARRITPGGYLGAPAGSDAAKGEARLAAESDAYAAAILKSAKSRR